MAFVEDQLTAEERTDADRYDSHQGFDKALWIPRLIRWVVSNGALILCGFIVAYMFITRR